MNCYELKMQWKAEEDFAFQGWDFSHIDSRMDIDELPWDYEEILRRYLKPTDRLLDMGTGGGEFLLTIGHPHELTSVTEAYLPNVELCMRRLTPLGITVAQTYDDDHLPFADESFDIVLNRHESFDPAEVHRVLKPGGYFITQQVGSANNNDLSAKLIEGFVPQNSQNCLSHWLTVLEKLKFSILTASEAFPVERFFDIGALVYYAKIIQWEFPNFSVDTAFDRLCACQQELEKLGFVKGTAHRFIIAAKKVVEI